MTFAEFNLDSPYVATREAAALNAFKRFKNKFCVCLRFLHAGPVDLDMWRVVVVRPDTNDDIAEAEEFAHM